MSASSVKMSAPPLDGLRGFAFLLVLLAHFSNHYDLPLKGVGKVGVWIFFALSAFLLTRQLLAKERPLARENLLVFFQRRALRIVPPYFAALIIFGAFGYLIRPRNILGHLLFIDGRGHFWTVAVEVQFYVVLPLIAAGVLWLKRKSAGMAGLSLVALWALSFIIFPPSWFGANESYLVPYFGVFIAGSCAAFFALHFRPLRNAAYANITFFACAAVLIVTTPSVWSALVKPVPSDYFYWGYPLFSVVAAALVLCCLVPGSLCATFFNLSFFRFLGAVSFSGYLMHPLALKKTSYLQETIGTLPSMAISLLAVIALTAPIYYWIERPLLERKPRYPAVPSQATQ